MTATTAKRYSCDECWLTPGQHWIEPDDPSEQPYSEPCPVKAATLQQEQARQMTTDQHTKAAIAAQGIMRDLAQTRTEFSANDCRAIFEQAQVPPSLIGYAFRWAKAEGLIEETGRHVQSTEATTRHRIQIWQSLVRGAAS